MYMLRAYQSPYPGADCGPQCAQIPNLASRYQAGTCQVLNDSRVPLKGPGVISNCAPAARARLRMAGAAITASAWRLVNVMSVLLNRINGSHGLLTIAGVYCLVLQERAPAPFEKEAARQRSRRRRSLLE